MNFFPLAQSMLDKVGKVDWHLMAFICIAFGAIGYFSLQRGMLKSKSIAIVGVVLLTGAGFLAAITNELSLDVCVFLAFCGLAIGGGIAFLSVRQPIYAALGFATAILSGAGVLFLQSATFIAAATIIVYAGATIIMFLFVLMFSQQDAPETYDLKLTRPFFATIIGALFLGVLVYSLQTAEDASPDEWKVVSARPLSAETTLDTPSSTVGLGRSLFTEYLFTVEIAGTLLLAATIGSIAVAQRTIEVSA
ncbi:MAG: NADH-quinone oxidoreductase subunit J [Pirellulaceae bacterium]|nr:NADH-quinone oxidoreductase subunit J [Pirellulaceae bacterium]